MFSVPFLYVCSCKRKFPPPSLYNSPLPTILATICPLVLTLGYLFLYTSISIFFPRCNDSSRAAEGDLWGLLVLCPDPAKASILRDFCGSGNRMMPTKISFWNATLCSVHPGGCFNSPLIITPQPNPYH